MGLPGSVYWKPVTVRLASYHMGCSVPLSRKKHDCQCGSSPSGVLGELRSHWSSVSPFNTTWRCISLSLFFTAALRFSIFQLLCAVDSVQIIDVQRKFNYVLCVFYFNAAGKSEVAAFVNTFSFIFVKEKICHITDFTCWEFGIQWKDMNWLISCI